MKKKPCQKCYTSGFTLIEVMVVVAIIGLLAAIAWPIFEAQLLKQKRADGIGALITAQLAMEQCRSSNANAGTYTGCNVAAVVPAASPEGYYAINVTLATINVDVATDNLSYTLTATKNLADDDDCVTLTLTNLGQKNNTGDGSVQRCWGSN